MCRARIASNEPAALGGRMPTGHVSVVHRLAPRTFASSSWHSAAKSTLFCTKFRCLHACPTTTRREHAVSSGCTAAPLSGVTCRKWLRPRNSRRLREPRDHKISNNKGAQDNIVLRTFVVRNFTGTKSGHARKRAVMSRARKRLPRRRACFVHHETYSVASACVVLSRTGGGRSVR